MYSPMLRWMFIVHSLLFFLRSFTGKKSMVRTTTHIDHSFLPAKFRNVPAQHEPRAAASAARQALAGAISTWTTFSTVLTRATLADRSQSRACHGRRANRV